MEELYRTLGYAKCVELSKKSRTFWDMLKLPDSRKNAPVGGAVLEGIAKDFIREFLPTGFKIKGGLIFDIQNGKLSPEIDAIIYRGVPLLEFTNAVIAEPEQVQAIFEIKWWIGNNTIFKESGERNSEGGLFEAYEDKRHFIQSTVKYILFVFALESNRQDDEVDNRLREISDMYAIRVGRR